MTPGPITTPLTPEERRRALELLEICLTMPVKERRAFLLARVDVSERVRAEVLSLLDAAPDDAGPSTDALRGIARQGIREMTPPRVLAGRYELGERLGAGGMAQVFRGKLVGAKGFEKALAIKRIGAGQADNEVALKLFEQEAKICASLSHPNLIQVHDFVHDEGALYIVMEYVSGRDLAAVLAECAKRQVLLPTEVSVHVVAQILRGLEHAHAVRDQRIGSGGGVIHRDISPKNVMVTLEGRVKLIDFGIAKSSEPLHSTQSGLIRGTVSYMSPEQANGEVLDARTDLFSTGLVLYELLHGEPFFPSQSWITGLKEILAYESPELPIQGLPVGAELKAVLRRALQANRDARYPSARAFLSDLELVAERYPRVEEATLTGYLGQLYPGLISASAPSAPRALPPRARRAPARRRMPPPSPSERGRSSASSDLGTRINSPFLWLGLLLPAVVLAFSIWWSMNVPPDRPQPIDVAAAPVPDTRAPLEKRRDPADVRPTETAEPTKKTEPTREPVALAPGTCALAITSVPPGALIRLNGATLDKTPSEITVACKEPFRLELVLEGFRTLSEEIAVSSERGSYHHVMER